MTLSIDTQHNSIEYHCAECRIFIINILRVIMLNVVGLRVVTLSAVAPSTANGGGTVVEHLTLNRSIKGLNPDTGKEIFFF
jgi:hypothetical protein